eukprot:10929091-Ditylum_brightwellii.AAC.1
MQTNTFFTSSKQMEVAEDMLEELRKEEIKEAEDLAKLTKDMWKQVADNMKRLGGQMKNLDKEADKNHAMVLQTLYLSGVKTQKRLLKVYKLMRYYKMGCHRVTVLNTVYKTVIKSFTDQ